MNKSVPNNIISYEQIFFIQIQVDFVYLRSILKKKDFVGAFYSVFFCIIEGEGKLKLVV
jgi:hypothetical protein